MDERQCYHDEAVTLCRFDATFGQLLGRAANLRARRTSRRRRRRKDRSWDRITVLVFPLIAVVAHSAYSKNPCSSRYSLPVATASNTSLRKAFSVGNWFSSRPGQRSNAPTLGNL